jgi:uncharacterized membrane protein
MPKTKNSALSKLLIGIILLVASVSLIRSAHSQGIDFEVFWKAARYLIEGNPLYSVSRDGGMVFKYPPWIATLFIPLGFLSLSAAKWVWGTVSVTSLLLIVRWLVVHFKIETKVWMMMLTAYWGLWIVHALDNQVVLPILAAALYLWEPRPSYFRQISMVYVLSTKIFTLFPILSTIKNLRSSQFLGIAIMFFTVFSLPAIWNEPKHSAVSMFRSWSEAAVSAGTALNPTEVRGRRNPSLPGLVLRVAGVSPQNSKADVTLALIFCVAMGLVWYNVTRGFPDKVAWLGWLALTPVIHPLPWWHLYIFTFPMAVWVVQESLQSEKKYSIQLSGLFIFLICCSTESFLGTPGVYLELALAKTWGTLGILGVAVYLRNQS